MGQLDGRVTVVTGAASGLGRATAERFAAGGARLVLGDIDDSGGRAVADELGADFLHTDVTDETRIAALVDRAVSLHGRLDCMINNAGLVGAVGPVADLRREDWDRTLAVLLTSVYLGVKHAARVMIPQKSGVILSTTSIAGIVAVGPFSYTAAKHGVVGVTRAAASELAEHGIRVNAIAPGTVPTALTGRVYGSQEAARNAGAQRNPMGRTVEPEDIAGGFAYLAGPDARGVTGQVLIIDGGQSGMPATTRYQDMAPSVMDG